MDGGSEEPGPSGFGCTLMEKEKLRSHHSSPIWDIRGIETGEADSQFLITSISQALV